MHSSVAELGRDCNPLASGWELMPLPHTMNGLQVSGGLGSAVLILPGANTIPETEQLLSS